MAQKNGNEGTERRMTIRLRKTLASASQASRIKVVEPRGSHFKKTLFLAGALGLLAFCVYFFAHTASVQANNGATESSAGAAAPSQP